MLREIKPKNARSARASTKRAPLIIENPKTVLFLKSTSSSSLLNTLLSNLHSLKRPLAVRFTKKNPIHPFEDASSLEFFSEKNDASLLCFASHSKKRPHTLTFVRCFGSKVLDMLECSVQESTARTLAQFGGGKCRLGTKPLLSFSGTQFECGASGSSSPSRFELAKSMFIDFFRGVDAKEVDVENLQMMISFAAAEEEVPGGEKRDIVYMRVWRVITRRSGQKLPRVELEEIGPRIDFRLGRMREADDAAMKQALKQARGTEVKSKKNIETDIVGDKMGRIHLGKQDLSDLQTRKMKGLKRGRDDHIEDAEGVGEGDEYISNDNKDQVMTSEDEDGNLVEDGTDGDADGIVTKRPRRI